MKTLYVVTVCASGMILGGAAALGAQTATSQPATATAPATSQPASQLPTLAGRWSVKRTATTNTTALGQLVTDIAGAETWNVTVNKDQVAITEEKITKAGKPFSKEKPQTKTIKLDVSGITVTGDKATFVVKETERSATTTTTYHLQLNTGETVKGTYTRDRDVTGPLGSIRSHEEGTVQMDKLAS